MNNCLAEFYYRLRYKETLFRDIVILAEVQISRGRGAGMECTTDFGQKLDSKDSRHGRAKKAGGR